MPDAKERMPVAVLGAGRMGRHHARTYANLEGCRLVGVVDPDSRRAAALSGAYGGGAFDSAEALLEAEPELAAVSVAAPTHRHLEAAEPLLRSRIACLIEKPLAPSVAEARRIQALADESEAVLQVGHTERFNPAVRAVERMGMTARFIEVDRISPMTFRSLDVGVVMDMMIHDLDIVLMLAECGIDRVEATGVAVIADHEDIANARIVFNSGCVASLSASRLALKTERRLRLFSEAGYVSLDYANRTGWAVTAADNLPALDEVRSRLAQGEDLSQTSYADLLNVQPLNMDGDESDQDPLTAQLAGFLRAARRETPPAVSAEAGIAAIDAAERVLRGIQAHSWSDLASPPLPTSRP